MSEFLHSEFEREVPEQNEGGPATAPEANVDSIPPRQQAEELLEAIDAALRSVIPYNLSPEARWWLNGKRLPSQEEEDDALEEICKAIVYTVREFIVGNILQQDMQRFSAIAPRILELYRRKEDAALSVQDELSFR